MTTQRCPTCWNDLGPGSAGCATCGATAAGSVGAVASRDYRAAPLPAGPYDVELGPAEVLSATFRMWSRDWGRLFVLAAVPMALCVPFVAAVGVLAVAALGIAGDNLLAADLGQMPGPAALATLIGVGVVGALLLGLVSFATSGAMLALVDERERTGENALSTGQALLVGLARSGRLFVGWLITVSVMLVAAAAGLVPFVAAAVLDEPALALGAIPGLAVAAGGIWLLVRLSPLWPVLVVEDLSFAASLRRAFELTRNQAGMVFVCWLVAVCVAVGLSMAATIFSLVPLFGLVVQLVANLAMSSLGAVYLLALYAGLVNQQQR